MSTDDALAPLILSEVEPYFARDGSGTPASADYRCCDCCGAVAYADPSGQERAWYEVRGEGLIVCAHCLPDLLAEELPS